MHEHFVENDNSIATVSSYIEKAKSSFLIIKSTIDKQAPIIFKAVENVIAFIIIVYIK